MVTQPEWVTVLFARGDSVYKTLPGCDVWDEARDALRWPGGDPVVAHPPCRAWGQLAHLAKPQPGERDLAVWAVHQVREWGGVLEHPRASRLWQEAGLPSPGSSISPARDRWGGWTMPIRQSWWGHRAEKSTLLYIVGCEPGEVPDMPLMLGQATHVITQGRTIGDARLKKGMRGWRPEVTRSEREATPPALAAWLCELARRCRRDVPAV